ncbi:hypothetical protein Peur_036199 [Populus x canadensis]
MSFCVAAKHVCVCVCYVCVRIYICIFVTQYFVLINFVWSQQYWQMRGKEQDRLARMDADYQRRKEMAEFTMRREERMKAAEERTVKSV